MKKIEFSKWILIIAGSLNIIVIVFSCIMVAITQDLSPLMYLIPSLSAEVATGTAFYYNKAKMENKLKLCKYLDVPITEDTINNA